MRQYLSSRIKSFRFAFEGIGYVFLTQKNAQIHLIIIILVLALAFWLAIPLRDLALILLTIGMVLGAEFINTALEEIINLVSPGQHPLAKTTKDVGAGAVMLLAIIAVLIGILILGPPLLEKLNLTSK